MRKDRTFGNEMLKGNDGMLARAKFSLNKVLNAIDNMSADKTYDPDVLRVVQATLDRIRNIIDTQKGKEQAQDYNFKSRLTK